MGSNPYEELLDGESTPAAAAPTSNPFDDTLEQLSSGNEQRMRASFGAAASSTPDQAAEARRLGQKFGVPTDAVQRDFATFQKRDDMERPYAAIQKETPKLAAWLETPANAAVAKDDLENLGFLEWLVTAPQRAFAQTINQSKYAELRYASMFKTLTQAEHDQLESYRYNMEIDGAVGAGKSWFRKAVTGTAGFIANQAPVLKYGLVGTLEGAAIGAGIGSVAPGPGTVAGAVTGAGYGFRAGLLVGVLKSTFQQEAGNAFDEFSNFRDENGRPLDLGVARAAALAVGAINAPIEAGAQELLLRSIPGLSKLTGTGVRASVTTALRNPTIRAALLDAAKSYGSTLTGEVGQEVAQRAVTILAGEIAKGTDKAAAVPGQLEPGNVDLYKQPRVVNADGSVSTVDSLSVNIDGQEVLLPTVTPGGEHFVGTPEEKTKQAINEYQKTGRHLGKFDTPAAADAFAQKLHEDYAAGTYDQASKFRGAGAIAADLMNEGIGALQSFALGVLPGPLLSAVHGAHQVAVAKQNAAMFTALGEGVAQSKTAQRMPDAMQAFVEHATKDGPVAQVYAPVDTWETYWQSKGIDPANVAAEVTGSRDAYDRAKLTGEDLVIPTARYAARIAGTEHNAYFANELRLQPGAMNAREADVFSKQLEDEAAAAPLPVATAPTELQQLRAQLAGQLGQHYTPDVADAYAGLHESIVGSLAARAEVPTSQVFGRYGLTVTQEGVNVSAAADVAPAAAQSVFESVTAPLTTEDVAALDRRQINATPPGGIDRRLGDNEAAKLEQEAESAGVSAQPIGNKTAVPLEPIVLAAQQMMKRDPTLFKRAAEARRRGMAADRSNKGPQKAEATATFLAYGPQGAVYNVVGGPSDGSTLAAAELQARGIAIPDTPADTGERLNGDQLRQRMLDARAAAGQTTADDTGAEGARSDTRQERRPAIRRVEESTPASARESAKQQDTRRERHFADVFSAVLDAARSIDPQVDVEQLRKEFNDRVDFLEAGEDAYRESGHDPRALLQAIAKAGGISLKSEQSDIGGGYTGEIKWLRDSPALGPFGSYAGVRGVFQTRQVGIKGARTGLSLDDMRTALAQDERFNHLESVDDLLASLADIARLEVAEKGGTFPGTDELARRAGVNMRVAWWNPDQTEYAQKLALFDQEDDAAAADTLDTGEQQPRLPGDAGAVRDAEVAAPEFDAPFSLTSPTSKAKGKQTTLFQPAYHGSPHLFEKFSLQAIGSGEGAQAYGWGLYFASKREVAEGYRDRLAESKDATIGGHRIPGWIAANVALELRGGDPQYSIDHLIAEFSKRRAEYQAKIDAEEGQWWNDVDRHANADNIIQALEAAKAGEPIVTPGRLYKVEIPEDEDFIDWDKPLDKQSPKVQAALEKLGVKFDEFTLPSPGEAIAKINGAINDGQAGRFPIGGTRLATLREGHALAVDARITGDEDAFKFWWVKNAGLVTPFADVQFAPMTGETAYQALGIKYGVEQTIQSAAGPYSAGRSKNEEAASRALAGVGIAGIRYLDGFSRSSGEGTSNYVVFDDRLVQITEYNQAAAQPQQLEQDKRGAIRFGADRQFNIQLFANADLSTFLHETGHFYLEVFNDLADDLTSRDPATLSPSQRQLLGDSAAIFAFLGVDKRADIGTDQHEKWARAFEAYLMQGQAPSLELRGAFARFRAWLTGVYKSMKALKVTLSPEISAVMDRLLATDEAIADAKAEAQVQPIFTDARSAGMSDREFALYRSTIEDASRDAQEKLQAKLLSEVQREKTAEWKRRRDEIRADVADAIHAKPQYIALAAIQRGTFPDGTPLAGELAEPTPMKLSRQAIVDEFGKARLSTLPRPYLYTDDGTGLDPKAAAELFGFSSGDELLTALATAGDMKTAIEAETDKRMILEHGSLLLDGTIADKAKFAIANESRDAVVRAELKALANLKRLVSPHISEANRQATRERSYERRWLEAEAKLRIAIAEGRKQVEIDELQDEVDNLKRKAAGGPAVINGAIPPQSVIVNAARTRVAQTRVRDLRPQLFWSASRKAARAAVDAAARQDFDAAIVAQQQQLLNLALYREAEQALEDVDDRVRQAKALGTPAARQRLGKAGGGFLEQVDAVLERYEFAEVSGTQLGKRAELRRWIAAMEGEGQAVELPEELINDSRRINYSELTIDELVGVTDGLRQLVHLARMQLRRLQAAKEEDYVETRDAVAGAILEHGEARPQKLELLPKDKPGRVVAEWFASHTKLAQTIAALDGYVDGGPVWDAIMRPINDAATKQASMSEAAGIAIKKLVTQHYTGRDLAHFHDQLFIPALGASLSKEARIAVALNWGNEGNRQRLMESGIRKWNAQQVQAILDTLDRRDLDFVQGMLDYVNGFWPEIAAKQTRVFGVAPDKVEAASWNHSVYGEQRGGYYPIAYDGRLSVRQGNIIDADQASLQKHANYAYATTKRGYTKAREERVNSPVRLELSVAFEHVEAVIHDLSHHEMLIDVGRLMGDRKVQQAIASRAGDIVYKQMRAALLDIALGNRHFSTIGDRALTYVKNGTTIAGLGWNVWTSLQQPLGVFNGMARIGPTWVARGMARMFRDAGSMEWSARWVAEKSEMMRLRGSTQTREIADLRSSLQRSGSWFDNALRTVTADVLEQEDITNSFLFLIEKTQQLADLPVWIGGYEKAMAAGETEARAIALADQGVLDSQSGGQIKDLAQIQRGGPTFRLFTTFYSYGNLVFNQTARTIGQFKRTGSVGQMLGNLSLLYLAPAAATVALATAFGKEDPKDADGYLLLMGRELLATAMNTMFGIRELSVAVQTAYGRQAALDTHGARGYEGPAGLRIVGAVGNLITQAQQGKADRGLLRAAEDVAGILFHLPIGQVQRSIDGFVALEEGRTSNPGALLVGPPRKGQ